jgi:hypothetical protein
MRAVATVITIFTSCIAVVLFAHASFDTASDPDTRRNLRKFALGVAIIAVLAAYVAILS